MSTVSRGTPMQASSRSDDALVNELTFNESERVASGSLQVREKLRIESAGVTRAHVDVRVVGGKDASHSFCLLLNEPVAIVGQEQVVFLVAIVDVEVLDARVQQLQLGALALEVRSTTMPALDFTLTLRTTRCAILTLDEGQFLTVRIAHALQSWRGYVVSEQVHGLDNCLRIVVGSLLHVVRQVHLELEVSAVVGSVEQHAREVAFAAYFFGFDDWHTVCSVVLSVLAASDMVLAF